jgi:carbon monoxide dehydrogenase subunit G
MQLNNSFTVPVPVAEAWAALMNLEEVAGCIPGATLQSTDGDEFAGQVKVKMGPVALTYNGEGRFVERNETLHRAIIEASGKETKGSGSVKAQTTATLYESGTGANITTEVQVTTDLDVTGKAAQFGRGVMEDVSGRIFGQFADALASQLTAEKPSTASASADTTSATPSADAAPFVHIPRHSPEAIDLLSIAGGPIARRLAIPVLLIAVLVAVAILVLG